MFVFDENEVRAVLADLGCLDRCEFKYTSFSSQGDHPKVTRMPGVIFKFDYPEAEFQPALVILFVDNKRSVGDVVREKVTEYLGFIGYRPS